MTDDIEKEVENTPHYVERWNMSPLTAVSMQIAVEQEEGVSLLFQAKTGQVFADLAMNPQTALAVGREIIAAAEGLSEDQNQDD